MAAPQGFEPRYADPESAVLPLNEGAVWLEPVLPASLILWLKVERGQLPSGNGEGSTRSRVGAAKLRARSGSATLGMTPRFLWESETVHPLQGLEFKSQHSAERRLSFGGK
jgi:hypothetical protein